MVLGDWLAVAVIAALCILALLRRYGWAETVWTWIFGTEKK
jgi:hypothetical protein